MNNSITSYIGWLLILSALSFYLYGIGQAIHVSWDKAEIPEGVYPEVLSTTISSIQALLLTNLGIILGISVAKPQSAIAQSVLFNRNQVDPAAAPQTPLELKEKLQLIALVIYILGLIACIIVWIHKGFSTDSKHVVSIIPQSGQMFIGIVLAYLTAVFSR